MDLLPQQESQVKKRVQADGSTLFLASNNKWYGEHNKEDFCAFIDETFLQPVLQDLGGGNRRLWQTVVAGMNQNDLLLTIELNKLFDGHGFSGDYFSAVKEELLSRLAEQVLLGS